MGREGGRGEGRGSETGTGEPPYVQTRSTGKSSGTWLPRLTSARARQDGPLIGVGRMHTTIATDWIQPHERCICLSHPVHLTIPPLPICVIIIIIAAVRLLGWVEGEETVCVLVLIKEMGVLAHAHHMVMLDFFPETDRYPPVSPCSTIYHTHNRRVDDQRHASVIWSARRNSSKKRRSSCAGT